MFSREEKNRIYNIFKWWEKDNDSDTIADLFFEGFTFPWDTLMFIDFCLKENYISELQARTLKKEIKEDKQDFAAVFYIADSDLLDGKRDLFDIWYINWLSSLSDEECIKIFEIESEKLFLYMYKQLPIFINESCWDTPNLRTLRDFKFPEDSNYITSVKDSSKEERILESLEALKVLCDDELMINIIETIEKTLKE